VVRIESNIANAQLTLDGAPITAPFSFTGVEGIIRTLGVVTPQTSNGTTYDFVSWSDGGQATHEIVTPNEDTTFTALFQPGATNVLFSDDFEAARGWTLTGGANTATTGRWQRGDPQATSSSGITLQTGTCDGPSVNCLITGLTAGSAVGANDVDGGQTSIQSPAIAIPAGGTVTLRFRSFFAHLNNATSADFFRVRVVGNNGQPVTVYTQSGTASNVAAAWATRSVNISSFAGQTVQLRVEAADAGSASLIEAGIDNITITRQ
jgi:aminopeptidase S